MTLAIGLLLTTMGLAGEDDTLRIMGTVWLASAVVIGEVRSWRK